MEVSAINELSTGVAPVPTTPAMEVEQRREMIQAVRAVNAEELFGQENELSFAFDRHSQRAVVRIVDKKTREVVQQIPNEQVLRLAEELQQRE
jgi:flagellar protein FlaG